MPEPGIKSPLVFFPAYNDEENIGKVADSAVEVLEELGFDYVRRKSARAVSGETQ